MRRKLTIEKDVITLPVYWASFLINGDASGLEDAELQRASDTRRDLNTEAWTVCNIVDGSKRFTRHYNLYDPGAEITAGDVADYEILRAIRENR